MLVSLAYLRLLLGELGVEEGDLYLPTGWRVAHMAQEVEASDRCAVDYVIDGDKTYREIEHGIETATCDNELANWHSKMDAHNGYNIKVQAEQLLHGLGFKQSDMVKPVSGFLRRLAYSLESSPSVDDTIRFIITR